MKNENYFVKAFAVLGFVSFIFFACAASEVFEEEENTTIMNENGRYQISNTGEGSSKMFVIDTVTGEVKVFGKVPGTSDGYTYEYKRTFQSQ